MAGPACWARYCPRRAVLIVGLTMIAAAVAAFWQSGVVFRRDERASFAFSVLSVVLLVSGAVIVMYYMQSRSPD